MARPSEEAIFSAVNTMAEVIPFFPASPAARNIVHAAIRDICGDERGLEWLTSTACRVMTKFSIASLRALYCTRYSPCDGLPATACDIPGFTPAEAMDGAEMRYLMRESEENDRKMLEWKREFKARGELPAHEPLQIEGACAMPKPGAAIKQATDDRPVRNRVTDAAETTRDAAQRLRDTITPPDQRPEEEVRPPGKQVEAEVAALPRREKRTPEQTLRLIDEMRRDSRATEETRRLIDELERSLLQRTETETVQ